MANISSSARYTIVAAKNKWEEQGFHFDDSLPNYSLEQFVYNRLNELGWFRFARQPARANYNWVLEFYTSNSAGEDNALVRGRRVAANATTINSILDLPNDDPSFYAMLSALEDEDFEQIKDFLCEEDTAWNTTGRNPYSVSRLSLRLKAKLWNTFVKRNIMPTSHNQTVDRTRLLLIHTIITGYRINVGEILAKEPAAACTNDKGILAFPCLISALCRRATVPTSPSDKYQAEKKGWTRAVYMRKMDVADATPLNMAMPTPPASPDQMPAAPAEEAGPSNPAPASSAPAEPRQPSADSPLVEPVVSNTTTSPAATPANMPASRESTPTSPVGPTPEAPHPPPPAQSDEVAPLHILQLRNQLQQIEARQLQMQEETKVFQQNLINFLCYQFPAAATYFNAQPEATAAAYHSTNTQPIPSANPSAQAGNTEEVHLSSDDENDIFDWQTPRGHPLAPRPTQQQAAATSARHSPDPADVPILQSAPIPAQPTMETHHRRKDKTTAGCELTRSDQSSPEEEATHQPAQKRRRCHIITSNSDDDCSAAVPTSSADPSLSFTF
ncbi:hypothetical protein V6N12_046546 [Hibiscus sabdariffa]|uniref:Putative plant transposon protein domain-containing protein n=1 Tax=Hibiscus sabdariffa TaxID=183260 RepID=A0ABR2DIY8_9ROSI